MMETYINNIPEYVERVLGLDKELKHDIQYNEVLYFRGQSNKEFKLLPSLARNSRRGTFPYERNLIESAKFKMPTIFNNNDTPIKSHSSGNIGKVQDLFEKYGDVRIPSICEDWIKSEKEKFDLIEPEIISNICRKILDNKDVDEVGMRERVEGFKKLSDEGYYLSYEYE